MPRIIILLPLVISLSVDLEDNVQQRFSTLLNWVQEGIDAAGLHDDAPRLRLADNFDIHQGSFGLSLVAKRQFEPDELMLALPASRYIHEDTYGDAIAKTVSAHGKLAYWLACERHAGNASAWAPYIRMLPAHGNDMLPHRWLTDDFDSFLNGSYFKDYVSELREFRWREFKQMLSAMILTARATLTDFEWAIDILGSRVTSFDHPDGSRKMVILPIYDLTLHGTSEGLQNMESWIDPETNTLKVTATRRILEGEAIFNKYYELGKVTNYLTLEHWGFASEMTSMEKKEVRLHVSSKDAVQLSAAHSIRYIASPLVNGANFSLTETALDGEGEAFLGYLRHLANGGAGVMNAVSCGQHVALNCESCPAGHGADWCNGYCKWINGSCVFESTVATMRNSYYRTTWDAELAAARIGQILIQNALAAYPGSLEEDEALLERGVPDVRLHFLLLIRRDEKAVLTWWLRYLQQCAHTPAWMVSEL